MTGAEVTEMYHLTWPQDHPIIQIDSFYSKSRNAVSLIKLKVAFIFILTEY